MRISINDAWSRQLLIALCRRYGLRPYRYPRMHRQTLIVKAPRSLVETVLLPEFEAINAALIEYLSSITERIIREEVYRDVADADEFMPAMERASLRRAVGLFASGTSRQASKFRSSNTELGADIELVIRLAVTVLNGGPT
jgi:hypothetical protein